MDSNDNTNLLHIEEVYNVSPGAEGVTVPVYLNMEEDLFSLTFDIIFDPERLEATALERDESRVMVSLGPDAIDNINGRIIVSILDMTGQTAVTAGQGKLLDVVFNIKDLPDETILQISNIRSVYDIYGSPHTISIENGKIGPSQPCCMDLDNDGYGDPNNCVQISPCPFVLNNADCDDTNQDINPSAPEVCNTLDDDCDGLTDEEGAEGCLEYYKDQDQDGYGVDGDSRCLCSPEGYYNATQGGDTDDLDPNTPVGKITFELELPSGWSMISLPLELEDALVSSVLPNAVVVYGYEKGSGYIRVKNEEELIVGKGYWVLFSGEQSYPLKGRQIHSYTHTVNEAGWEMIGGCTTESMASSDNCSIGVIYGYVQGSGYQRVLQGQSLQPCKGYWILFKDVTESATLMVGP